ncbi:hypothetical protein PN498_19430 [Oscillatoria sp. CS-180]|uniref:hypothetical protein n=1 Tax=Oscillatoria sp. CS-180 TaxID=3021720 RepID=UPI00232E506E|nr:hypothetical protein [Oscillatoria sp. CS-180]MDB9528173.1 hypothetical protein [Oscillatoria sp. CS-180]
MSLSIIDQVIKQLSNMPQSLQQQVLQFAYTLNQAKSQGTPGSKLVKFAGSIQSDDLALMQDAIDEGCGQVNLSEW